jgi:hypothetical protein
MKKPEPIHLIVSRLKRMPLHEKAAELVKLLAAEKPHSVRGNELWSLLNGVRQRQLKYEKRRAA